MIERLKQLFRAKKSWVPYLIFAGICFIYAIPILKNFENIGHMDWDQFTFWNAISRDAFLNYHQFPLWNPYSSGGTVLLAFPHSAFLSPLYIFILLFGPVVGLKIQWILSLFFGMVGMFLLSESFGIKRIARFCAPIVFMLSSYFTLHMSEGHAEYIPLAIVPWAFLCLKNSVGGFKRVILLALCIAFMFLSGSVDVLSHVVFAVILYALFLSIKEKRVVYLKVVVGAFLLAALICAVKLLPMADFIHENPRKMEIKDQTSFSMLPVIFLSRDQALLYQNTRWTSPYHKIRFQGYEFDYGWHEYGAYVGSVVLVLAFIGLMFYGRRYWPLVLYGLISLCVSLGGGCLMNIWSFLQQLPFYSSFHVPSRHILGCVFVISIFSAFGLSKLEVYLGKGLRKLLVVFLVVFICFDLLAVNYPLLKNTFIINSPKVERMPEFRQRFREFNIFPWVSRSSMYVSFLNNSGIIDAYDVMTIKKGNVKILGEDGYRGEVYLDRGYGVLQEVDFSPNRIKVKFNTLAPDLLILNQNFHKGWKAKGAFGLVHPKDGKISVLLPQGQGQVELYYWPTSFSWGLTITVSTILCLIFLYFFKKKPDND